MKHVSSSATLFLKIVVPTVWIVFFGIFTLAMWFSRNEPIGTLSPLTFNIGLTCFFLFGVALLYWALIRLKRVEMDQDFVYVTNYFKTYRYSWDSLEKIEESDYLFFRSVHLFLKQRGQFGKKVTFVASRKRFNEFLADHPDVVRPFVDEQTEA
ncbi:MAG: hypothetical protein AAGD05_01115 [Bacteroidota bacterium]